MKNKHNAKTIKIISTSALVASLVVGLTALIPSVASAVTPGTESTYAVLAYSGITATGAISISGTAGTDVGTVTSTVGTTAGVPVSPGKATTDQVSMLSTYTTLSTTSSTASIVDDLGGKTLTAGVYTSGSSIGLTGTLTLSGTSSDVFIFQAPSTLTTASSSQVVLAGDVQSCNVYWQVGSSATLGTYSTFVGRIYASASITATTGAKVDGQLLAHTGAVTLDSNIIDNSCTQAVSPAAPAPYTGGNYNPVTVPAIPQSSYVTSVESENCTTTADYTVNLAGSYPTPLTNVDVNGRMMPASSYVQSANNVAITIPASATKSFSITLYNGMTPMIASTAFTCAEAAVVMPVEVAVPDPVITPTTTGGQMPQTATGNYNLLFTGVCLFALGGFGLLLRRRIKG
jgi:LPXTG-motif cell wall-anchored protein